MRPRTKPPTVLQLAVIQHALTCGIVGLFACCGVSRAVAGCGDYVLIDGLAPHADISPRDLPASLPVRTPCSGPNCSELPAIPAGSLVVVSTFRVDLTLQTVGHPATDFHRCAWPHPESSGQTISRPDSLLRPPR